MGEPRIAIRFDGPVAHIVLARPEQRNAIDGALARELRDAVAATCARDETRVIALSGRGPVFCAGADLEWMKTVAGYTLEQNLADAAELAGLFETIDSSPKAVVASVQGAALGGGAGLVAVADIAVAEEGARFAFSEVRLGLVPAVISPYVLRKIGESAARELFLTGERFEAVKACEIGLIRAAVPDADLDTAVDARVQELLKAGPRAIAEAKTLIREVAFRRAEDVQRFAVEAIADIRVSAEGQEGMRAFLEKRKPDWMR
jgi:methylglutaconyl-CoA hydratase